MTGSPYADLTRPPLSAAALQRTLRRDEQSLWSEVRVLTSTGSTNAEVAAAAREGAAEGLVVVAEEQLHGRGRRDRTWVSPPRAGLTFSLLFRPRLEPSGLPLLTLLVAGATAYALIDRTELVVRVKWPNDLVVDDRKVAGLLAERVDDAVVVGVGLNVSTRTDELPRSDATSLLLELGPHAEVDRATLLLAVLRSVGTAYRTWIEGGAAPETVLGPYRALSATLGRRVRAELPSGEAIEGLAVDVADTGALLVDVPGRRYTLAAADVLHLRPG